MGDPVESMHPNMDLGSDKGGARLPEGSLQEPHQDSLGASPGFPRRSLRAPSGSLAPAEPPQGRPAGRPGVAEMQKIAEINFLGDFHEI